MGVYDSQIRFLLEITGILQACEDAELPEENIQAFLDAVDTLAFGPTTPLMTVKQWEAAKGVSFPDDGAVYVKWYNAETGYPNPADYWDPLSYGPIKNDRNVFCKLVANSDTIPAGDFIPAGYDHTQG
jgi:hypothetical protein